MSPPSDPVASPPAGPVVYRMRAIVGPAVVIFYAVLILIVLLVSRVNRSGGFVPYLYPLLLALLFFFLLRQVTTRYRIDAETLTATRFLGGRRVRLAEVRKIQYANLRELGPVGISTSWGWRGRGWSPIVGRMDSVSTVSRGLLVTAGDVPVFISPVDPLAFRRELSRRVRSAGGGEGTEESVDTAPRARDQ